MTAHESTVCTEQVLGHATDFLIEKIYDTATHAITLKVSTVLPGMSFNLATKTLHTFKPPRYPWLEVKS
jgi:hypothetical protein